MTISISKKTTTGLPVIVHPRIVGSGKGMLYAAYSVVVTKVVVGKTELRKKKYTARIGGNHYD